MPTAPATPSCKENQRDSSLIPKTSTGPRHLTFRPHYYSLPRPHNTLFLPSSTFVSHTTALRSSAKKAFGLVSVLFRSCVVYCCHFLYPFLAHVSHHELPEPVPAPHGTPCRISSTRRESGSQSPRARHLSFTQRSQTAQCVWWRGKEWSKSIGRIQAQREQSHTCRPASWPHAKRRLKTWWAVW